MKIFMFAVVLALFVPTKEEVVTRRSYIRPKRDGILKTGSITSNDGIEENTKFNLNKIKENEIRDQIAESTEKKEITHQQIKAPVIKGNSTAKRKTGTVVQNIKNIITHDDVDGHRSALSEALLHQFHGPNEKVLFLPDDEEDLLKGEHSQLIEPGHQQIVLSPEALGIYQHPLEEKVQKLLIPHGAHSHGHGHAHGHHHHQPHDSKVLVLRRSQEDVLTHLHHLPQRVVYYPRGEELINIHHEAASHHVPKVEHVHSHGEKQVLYLPKISDETVAAINQLHYHPPVTHEEKTKMHYLPSVFASPEMAYKPYGGGYTLPVAPSVLSTLNVEHTGKVPVAVSNMQGFSSIGANSLVNHLHKLLQLQLSKSVLPHLAKHVKLAEQQVDKSHEIDLGSAIHHHFTIVKKVGVPYIKPVPYPVVQRVPILIERPRLVKQYLPSIPQHAYQVPLHLPLAPQPHAHHPHLHQSLLQLVHPYPKPAHEVPIKIPLSSLGLSGIPGLSAISGLSGIPGLSGLPSLYKTSPQYLSYPTISLAHLQKPVGQPSKSIVIQRSEPVLVKHESGHKHSKREV